MTEQELQKAIAEDLKAVLEKARSMGCTEVNAFRNIPLRNVAVVVDALEKQIPKPVHEQKWIDTKCDCGYVFSKSYEDGYYDIPYEMQTKYCPACGQKLDWSEV